MKRDPLLTGGASMEQYLDEHRIAVVIPSYKVTEHILSVIDRICNLVWRIYVVDDACPLASGNFVEAHCKDPRVTVVRHAQNRGVGGAVMTGYRAAIADGATIIVKVDGDGQMDPELLPEFVLPIISGEADYTKGNRFYDLANIGRMPPVRIMGNAALSLMAKLSTGYWDIFDPTNGYTAIHADVARRLPFDRISERYFFETDLLFRLGTYRAVVVDIPMDAVYGDEVSNLKVSKIIGEFMMKHIRNFGKRIFYSYFLRDLSLASIELVVGVLALLFSILFGGYHWMLSTRQEVGTPVGTIMIAALTFLTGLQLILAFFGFDIANIPKRPIHRHFPVMQRLKSKREVSNV
ncbi:glycosyltransferase family 2 protein [Cupriavidus sp. USMAHM13]|uniref:glycosyltransferase family 2 protein n=1 Tax=Cupriavidus sp. USMAHM13 TaxID=1389192 RepID=UPI000ADC2832|nr:glycosyltransferase family 2 protein [Cupriavidus sp. USMAHM13]